MIPLLLFLVWVPLCAWTLLVTAQLLFSFRAASPLPASGQAPRTVVFIPAHNEAATLEKGLELLLAEMPPSFEVVVLADNCSDDTARAAARSGATVWERQTPSERGKGFALRHGMRELRRLRAEGVVGGEEGSHVGKDVSHSDGSGRSGGCG